MLSLFWFLSLLVLLGIFAYKKLSLVATTLGVAILMVVGSTLGLVGWIGWLVFAIIAAPLNMLGFRQKLISKPVMAIFKQIMPPMSQTESDAIEAGTTWWDADIFSGKPDYQKLHNFPKPRLSAEEQAFIDGPVEQACRLANDFQITHKLADMPKELWDYLREQGFFSMIIKKRYGGLEFSAYAQSMVLQKLAGISGVLSSTVGVPNSLGPGELLQHYGTEEQKDYYLPRLAKGKEIPCFALTSPEAGSDAGAIPDKGVVCMGEWQGEQVLGMKLTWNKRYITLAPVATVLGLAFKLYDPEKLLGGKKNVGITCALIPTDVEGVKIGRRHFPLNVPFQNGPTSGDEVFVPIDFIIGGPEMAGQGWRMLVECLSVGRGIVLPSSAAGGTKQAALGTGAYAFIRRQFGAAIGTMEGVQEPLARLGGNAYLLDAASRLTTTGIDQGEKPSVISAIVKMHLTDRGQRSVIDAMDVQGGKAICMGPSNHLARAYQGAPIGITVEGANILTRNLIIYGQGAIRCHPYVLTLMQSSQSDALETFDKALFGYVGFGICNFVRSLWFGLSGARLAGSPYQDVTKRYYQTITRFSSNMALLSDVAMATLGGALKRKERVSARLGDILSQLYLATAALKRFEEDGRPAEDLPLLQWAVEDPLHKAQTAMYELLDNFPVALVGPVMKTVLFPFGPAVKRPSDKVDAAIAEIMMTDSPSRERMALGMFKEAHPNNPVGMMLQYQRDIVRAEPTYQKAIAAIGKRLPFRFLDEIADKALAVDGITREEAELLRKAEQGRLNTINVDDFDPQELVAKQQSITDASQSRPSAA